MRAAQFWGKLTHLLLAASILPALLCLAPRAVLSQTSDNFTNGAGTGLWSNPSNLSAGLPSSSDNILITGTGSSSAVTEDISATISKSVLNSGKRLDA